ncbi:MAG: type II toxin-antitoxin system HicA family toxin [Nitrospinota bacterium]
MTRLRRVAGKEVITALSKIGFDVIRTKGSHHFLHHPDGRSTVVPVHRGETIGAGLMSKILRDIEMTREEFMDIL